MQTETTPSDRTRVTVVKVMMPAEAPDFTLELPEGAEPLSVEEYGNEPFLLVMHPAGVTKTSQRRFVMIRATGSTYTREPGTALKFVASYTLVGGPPQALFELRAAHR